MKLESSTGTVFNIQNLKINMKRKTHDPKIGAAFIFLYGVVLEIIESATVTPSKAHAKTQNLYTVTRRVFSLKH